MPKKDIRKSKGLQVIQKYVSQINCGEQFEIPEDIFDFV